MSVVNVTSNMRSWYPDFKGIWESEVGGKRITLIFPYLLKTGPTEEGISAANSFPEVLLTESVPQD